MNYNESRLISKIGEITLNRLSYLGNIVIFMLSIFYASITRPFYVSQVFKSLLEIGFYSLPIVGFTAIFTGMVLALQSYTGFSRFSAEGAVATVVILSMTRELGPVLAGLMVSGRVGSAIAAEISSMKATEQIDALITLSVNPIRYLILPRVISATIVMPFLVMVANIIGVFGGYIVGVYKLGFNGANYIHRSFQYLKLDDITSGLIKAAVFGFIIAIVSSYVGYSATKGSEGVGKATNKAVVGSSFIILIANYILTFLLFGK